MKIFKRALIAAVASTFVVTAGGMAAPAFATLVPAEGALAATAVAPLSIIDPIRTGSLTIHKHAGPALFDEGGGSRVAPGQPGDGIEQTVYYEALAGAKFLVERVNNVDLTTAEG